MKEKNKEYLNNINLVRIVCAILLIFHHYQGLTKVVFGGINFYANKGWGYGYLTEVFFVISGFLSGHTILKKNISFRKYMHAKITRLFPFVFISNLIYLFSVSIFHILTHEYMYGEKYSVVQVLCAFLMIERGWIIDMVSFNAPIWYVDVLLICFAIGYATCFLAKKMRIPPQILWLGIVGIAIVINITQRFIPFFWNCNIRGYIPFFMGLILYSLEHKIESEKTKLIIGIVVCAIYIGVTLWLGQFNYYGTVIFLYPAIILILVSIPQVGGGVLRAVGESQFEAYLLSVPLFSIGMVLTYIFDRNIKHSYSTMFAFALFVEIMAILVYKFIEIPLISKMKNNNRQ